MTPYRIATVLILVLALGGLGAYVLYDQVLRGDSAAPLALPSSDPSSGASASAVAPALTAATAVGDWKIVSGSQAGYRVRERLADLPAESDAVGRTPDVTGTATLAAAGDSVQVTTADISVDTTTITSDKDMRDNRLRTQGLETDTYKTATFKLTSPVSVPAAAFTGATVDVTLHGDLTLHGVTKTVDIAGTARLSGAQIQVQGSVSFSLGDYGMTAPNIGGFIVSIADTGALEFVVLLEKA